jgi:hypothetical protein
MDVLAMLYFMVEVFRSDEDFGEELSELCGPSHLATADIQWR